MRTANYRAAGILILLAAGAVRAATPDAPECTMSARAMHGTLQIIAVTKTGYRLSADALQLIQVGTKAPERPTSVALREAAFVTQPTVRTWTMALVLTDKAKTRTWTSYLKGTWDGKHEDCKVERVSSGPAIPETGIVQTPPAMPGLGDVPDAYKLPAAVKSTRNGKWSNVGPTTGPAISGGLPGVAR